MRNSTWKRSGTVLLASAMLLLGACGDDGDDDGGASDTTAADGGGSSDTTAADGGGGAGLTISGFSFGDVSAAAGSTVAVTNDDGAPHTVTSDDDAWEEVQVGGGGTGEFTAPAEAGEYAFHCEIHTTMTGTLVVE
jgi:plastocyanin